MCIRDRDFPNEEIIINGGITSVDEIKPHLEKTDGIMIGRAAYHTPYLLADIEREIFNNDDVPSRQDVIEQLIPYVKEELKKGTRLNQIMRHTLGLFHGQTGASYWKRYLSEMQTKTKLPVTVKTRIGYDDVDDYESLFNFINHLKSTGVKTFIIHARKAMLGKFTPKQNLNIPPLKYDYVYKLKEDFPKEEIIINGGITSVDEIKPLLEKTDGVMIGRAAYHTPYLLADIEREIFNNDDVPSRQDVIEQLIPYVKEELKKGTRLNQIMRHTLGLFHGQIGASYWKRYLSENMCVRDADIKKIDHIMDKIKFNNVDTSVGQSA